MTYWKAIKQIRAMVAPLEPVIIVTTATYRSSTSSQLGISYANQSVAK